MEASDLAAAEELFGSGSNVDLDALQPKNAKEFEDFAAAVVQKYLLPHSKSTHYKVHALPLPSPSTPYHGHLEPNTHSLWLC